MLLSGGSLLFFQLLHPSVSELGRGLLLYSVTPLDIEEVCSRFVKGIMSEAMKSGRNRDR